MVVLSRLLFASCLVAATLATPTKRSIDQVTADISTILFTTTSLTTLVNTVNWAIPTILSPTEELLMVLQLGTDELKAAGDLSEADAAVVVVSVLAVQPAISNTVLAFVARKSVIAGGADRTVILSLLNRLNVSVSAFSDSLIQAVPSDYKTAAQAIQTNFIAGFSPAIALYSS
ncbi:hypothetical protein FB45DRAFT_1044934 [Roridomyces roridus]|uniref:Uncharacterized protein n=1 Tax=Roridomyces roridus TaxID=1738132 RepID=A0AAD7F5V3_9AGAR|nr:hypothetical protein FB45DRAFT_1044934 [Roridomyces roridus]